MAPSRGRTRGARQHTTASTRARPAQPPADYADSAAATRLSAAVLAKQLQNVLDVFAAAFACLLRPPDAELSRLHGLVQQVKGHLYARDFAAAFGRQELLEAYAARWSASRSLGYVGIFRYVLGVLGPSVGAGVPVRVVCVGGGGGAELCALVGQAQEQTLERDDKAEQHGQYEQNAEPLIRQCFDITLVDIADWSGLVDCLAAALTSPRPVSLYASAAVRRQAEVPLAKKESLTTRFLHADVLNLGDGTDPGPFFDRIQSADLVTLMFTLNELFATSRAKTQALLLDVTAAARPGMLLLVVDSAGSYSTVAVGGPKDKKDETKEKAYPMAWLLEHTLLRVAPEVLQPAWSDTKPATRPAAEPPAAWARLASTPSEWFRLPESAPGGGHGPVLAYPLELENMRYQLHLYRRL